MNAKDKEKFDVLVEKYKGLGYTEDHTFPGEYLLLMDPKTLARVRLYENGAVWEQNAKTGEYERFS